MQSLIRFVFILNTFIVSALMGQDPMFTGPINRGRVHEEITEASGLAASQRNSDVLWTHNDSGDSARLFAMDVHGVHLGIFHLEGIQARDWEDMAVGPGPVPNTPYLYVGDIGDNSESVPLKQIYRIPEPVVTLGMDVGEVHLAGADTLPFQYPDGAHDAETLMIDPLTTEFYVVTKGADSARVYRGTFVPGTDDAQVLQRLTALPLALVTGGDISPDGTEILLKTYTNIFYWKREAGESIVQTLSRESFTLPYQIEIQGEAVCWNTNSGGYFTLSEQWGIVLPHLYYYQRSDPTGIESPILKTSTFHLGQNRPNPFNGSTVIPFQLADPAHVRIKIYNLSGQCVKTMIDDYLSGGYHEIRWHGLDNNGISVPSGNYIYRLEGGSGVKSKQMHLVH